MVWHASSCAPHCMIRHNCTVYVRRKIICHAMMPSNQRLERLTGRTPAAAQPYPPQPPSQSNGPPSIGRACVGIDSDSDNMRAAAAGGAASESYILGPGTAGTAGTDSDPDLATGSSMVRVAVHGARPWAPVLKRTQSVAQGPIRRMTRIQESPPFRRPGTGPPPPQTPTVTVEIP